MVARCLDGGLPAAWAAADEAYGGDSHFRRALEERGLSYVVAVAKSQTVPAGWRSGRIDALIAQAPAEAWVRLSAGDGAKGPRLYDWAAAGLPIIPDLDPRPSHAPPLGPGSAQHQRSGGDRLLPVLRPVRHHRAAVGPDRPAGDGPSRTVSVRRRTSAAWTSMRCAATPPGIGTSPCPCWLSRSWPRWRHRPRKRGNAQFSRCHPPHHGRDSTAPGNCPSPTARTPHRPSHPEMVDLAPTTPSHRPTLPLPTKMQLTAPIQAGVVAVIGP
jgi:hypothetical protein